MDIKMFCRGSQKLAVKYRYYLKYNIMLMVCILAPIIIFMLDHKGIIAVGKVRNSSLIIAGLLIIWCVLLVLGCMGFGSVNALRYQIFGITEDGKIIHFWFKEMLRDGKVVLHFSPYHKRATKNEFIEVVKRKEEVIKDDNFEEFLVTLVNDEQVQKRSDVLFEVMDHIKILKETRKYVEVSYTIGNLGTKKKLKIHRNVKNLDELLRVMKENEEKYLQKK